MSLSNPMECPGASASVLAAFAPHAASGLILARITVSIRDEYRLLTAAGDLRGEPTGALLYAAARRAELPAVGDWVAARQVDAGFAIVHAVLPRHSQFSRRAAGSREDEQLIAANADLAFVVCGLDGDYNPRRIERYLTLAHESGAQPVIVLNKSDLCENPQRPLEEIRAIAGAAPVVAVSARDGAGMQSLANWTGPGLTVALLGSSGAGKSTLANRMLGEDWRKTNSVRESDSRGRHTTSHRELTMLPSGAALIDNPGMRELQLWASEESLEGAFEEIARLAARCRFVDCGHGAEPGCAVQAALANGELDEDRWRSYAKLRAEIRHHEVRADRNAAAAEKQRWKSIHKAARAYKKHW